MKSLILAAGYAWRMTGQRYDIGDPASYAYAQKVFASTRK